MANSYKYFTDNDRVSIRTPLYESVSLNSSSISQSSEVNLYTGSSNMYISFYDGAASSATSNLMFDMTVARNTTELTGGSQLTQQNNLYKQFSKILYGPDSAGAIQTLDLDFDDSSTNSYVLNNAIFLDFARGKIKDEIRKSTFALTMSVSGTAGASAKYVYLADVSGATNYKVDSPVGEYGALYVVGTSGASITGSITDTNRIQGLVFYQAGTVVLSPYIFSVSSSNAIPSNVNTSLSSSQAGILSSSIGATTLTSSDSATGNIGYFLTGSGITGSVEAVMRQIGNVSFQSTTEINSTVYFCRVFNNEFNFSANPTYLSSSQIVVKGGDPLNQPVSYITTVGLYSDDNQLLAVAKLSEPIKKTPSNELILRTRLDF
jgi:hypothetical protein